MQVGLLFMMFQRKYVQRLPWFFGYTVFHIVQFILLVVSYKMSYSAYFYAYWTTEGIDALLTLIVLQELFTEVFRPYEAVRDLVVLIFRWATMFLMAMALVSAAAARGNEMDRLVAGLLVMQRSVSLVQCGLLALLIGMYKLAGLNWRSMPMAIGFGFGVISSVSTVVMALRAYGTPGADPYFSIVLAGAYDIGVFIWVIAICAPIREVVTGDLPPHAMLERWNVALRAMHR